MAPDRQTTVWCGCGHGLRSQQRQGSHLCVAERRSINRQANAGGQTRLRCGLSIVPWRVFNQTGRTDGIMHRLGNDAKEALQGVAQSVPADGPSQAYTRLALTLTHSYSLLLSACFSGSCGEGTHKQVGIGVEGVVDEIGDEEAHDTVVGAVAHCVGHRHGRPGEFVDKEGLRDALQVVESPVPESQALGRGGETLAASSRRGEGPVCTVAYQPVRCTGCSAASQDTSPGAPIPVT